MASKRGGGGRVKPYSLTVKTYTASGKLSRQNIRFSSSRPYISPQENSLRGNEDLPNNNGDFETSYDLDAGLANVLILVVLICSYII